MKHIRLLSIIIFWLCGLSAIGWSSSQPHHEINARLEPSKHYLSVEDQVTLPAEQIRSADGKLHFLLHAGLKVASETEGIKIKMEAAKASASDFGMSPSNFSLPADIPVSHYSLEIPQTKHQMLHFKLKYSGEIYHPIESQAEEYGRSFSETPGIISAEGIVLSGASYWLAWFNDQLVSFNLELNLPEAWDAVSQGKRTLHALQKNRRIVRWESPEVMDEIYLVAAKFTEYSRSVGAVTAMVFLRQPDDELAHKYLETTAQYLEMYRQLIGPYAYSKFALVENFWETGYGMPSFTLLGPKVIRFPWILHSSYPHELLHNWWGNSVFVDYDKGNWCEGLTVYLADYLIKEQRGQAAEYRRSTLQKYTDYVHSNRDFPLTEFRSRHSAATEAVGYGKSMMLFHALRYELGDELFIKSIQHFYRNNKFKKASFAEVQQAFEEVTGKDYHDYFEQWVTRAGAPVLRITEARSTPVDSNYVVSFKLVQVQAGEPYRLLVPVAIHLMGKADTFVKNVELSAAEQVYKITCRSRPLRIDIDPQFDVFRKLDRNEIPPALSQLFGAEKVSIVLPSKASSDLIQGYRDLAASWARSEQVSVLMDTDLKQIPKDQALWFFGKENLYLDSMQSGLDAYDSEIKTDRLRIAETSVPFREHSLVLALRNPVNPAQTIAWLATDSPAALTGLGRKLPHYGKYSYLGFEGNEPTNMLKGQWPVIDSPLRIAFVYEAAGKIDLTRAKFPARKALAYLAPVFSEEKLLKHIEFLASDEMKGRGFGMPELDKAADYIANEFRKAGLQPGSDDETYFQVWTDRGGSPEVEATLKNVIGFIPGKKKGWEKQSVVVCAHYDHLGLGWPDVHQGDEGKIHNGADDNASGVSILIELAKVLAKNSSSDRTIVFVAFTAEECGLRGSKYYVENMKRFPAGKAIGCLNLDTVGRLGQNKLMIMGAKTAREWVHIFMGTGFVTGVKHELISQELDASDQKSFIRVGVPAVQFFSGPHFDYHRPTDDIEKIDSTGMVKIATFVREVIAYLAEREASLTVTISRGTTSQLMKMPPRASSERRAGLGTMPDFAYRGEGVKIAAISAKSVAEKAGLQKGDILLQLGIHKIGNLKEFSSALRRYMPGDEVEIVYKRNGIEKKMLVKLGAR